MNIGFENRVVASRVTGIMANPSNAAGRRLRERAAEEGRLLDATNGRKTRSLVIMDSGQVFMSAIHPETLELRLIEGRKQEDDHAIQEFPDGS